MSTRVSPPPPDLDYMRFAHQLKALSVITHLPRMYLGSRYGMPFVGWKRVRVHPFVSKRLRHSPPLFAGKGKFFHSEYKIGALGGEIRAGYDETRSLALNMWYNNRANHWDLLPDGKYKRRGKNPMAKVILPALSSVASGKIGDIVFMRRGGQNIARLRVKPSNPQTAAQTLVRSNLSGLAQAWRFAGTVGDVPLIKAPSTPVTFNYLTPAEKASWMSFQAFVGTNVRLLSEGNDPVRSGS